MQTKLDVCETRMPRAAKYGKIFILIPQPLGELAVQVWLLTIQTLNIALCL